mmetsp:Transcript_9802/g.24412  ORF Transcript_9802/g.24412 Transcript_9802/m.24412 type:complete len:123 (-) Transcript_9802:101-469(-)
MQKLPCFWVMDVDSIGEFDIPWLVYFSMSRKNLVAETIVFVLSRPLMTFVVEEVAVSCLCYPSKNMIQTYFDPPEKVELAVFALTWVLILLREVEQSRHVAIPLTLMYCLILLCFDELKLGR